MPDCEDQKNPLQRSGTSQRQRQLPGLTADYVRMDERRYSDWIVFAVEFSKRLKFYDSATGLAANDWHEFFATDAAAQLGMMAVQDVESYRLSVKKRFDFLRSHSNAADEAGLRRNLSELFSVVFTLSKTLNDYYLHLTDKTTFKATMQQSIHGKLGPAFARLLLYYDGAASLNLYQAVDDPTWRILGQPLEDAKSVRNDLGAFISDWWEIAGIDPKNAQPDVSVFGSGASVFAKINHAANHFLFTSVFDQFTETYTRLIAEAEAALTETLGNWDTHKPHYALFLAFLKLFRTTQTRLNGLTWRHLDYYYKVVLKLQPKGAIPNKVRLIAELAKTVSSAALPSGTLFKAGKDSAGKEVVYALDKETTFNKAEVASFKAVYKGDRKGHDNWKDPKHNFFNNTNRLFAAPVMNSADGKGADLKSPFMEWHPFVNKTVGPDGSTTSINMPPAQIGFAVASHYLLLAEGTRTIRLRLDGDHAAALHSNLVCYLTTEKKWLEKTPAHIVTTTFFEGGICTEILINIAGTDPPITPFNAKVHSGAFNVDVPVVKFILKNELGKNRYGYEALKDIVISKIQVAVQVGTTTRGSYDHTGAKQLLLAYAGGDIDASKPFQPWGPLPAKDSPFVIGNKELFTKKNAGFNLNMEWANLPSSSPFRTPPSAKLQFLEGGVWTDATASTRNPIVSANQQTAFTDDVDLDPNALVDYRDAYTAYNPSSQAGFMRLVLNGDFGQEDYLQAYTSYLIHDAAWLANNPTPPTAAEIQAHPEKAEPTPPLKPYLPVISSLYLSYFADSDQVYLNATQSTFEQRAAQFFHIGPFGEAEQQSLLTGATQIYLVPQFRSAEHDYNVGEWYIGIKNLAPEQSVQILFQLLEGSTNPLVSKPQKHVEWSYLSRAQWKKFDDRNISDSTLQLVQSGIIGFAIPDDATAEASTFPTGYIWIRASVTESVDAVCKILLVQAQALEATFQPHDNAEDFQDHPLLAGTITKLKEPTADFKSFTQPYASFGGRQTETPAQFYLRSSERLRHKGRAVTIWDYERLVLEAFPQLYKAKCLNHTQVKDDPESSKAIYNEDQPGYVSVITIPKLSNRNEVNPLKPYTSQSLLSEITEFLKDRITGQLIPKGVNVNVCNPLFEEVSMEFRLSLSQGYTDFTYYSQLLADELTRYLSPWAYSPDTDVQFGGKISKSTLIDFIEERPYVDFITDVVMNHKPENKPQNTNVEEAVATTARSILVSTVSTKHKITDYNVP